MNDSTTILKVNWLLIIVGALSHLQGNWTHFSYELAVARMVIKCKKVSIRRRNMITGASTNPSIQKDNWSIGIKTGILLTEKSTYGLNRSISIFFLQYTTFILLNGKFNLFLPSSMLAIYYEKKSIWRKEFSITLDNEWIWNFLMHWIHSIRHKLYILCWHYNYLWTAETCNHQFIVKQSIVTMLHTMEVTKIKSRGWF